MERYKTFAQRFWAGIIDGLVLLPIGLFNGYFSSPARGPVTLVLWATFFYSVGWVYSVTLHARYGQTVGKRLMHVKVLDVSEQRIPSLSQALLRDSGGILLNVGALIYFIYLVLAHRYVHGARRADGLPGQILDFASLGWFLLEVFTMLANHKRRAFHDLIAKTVVVNLEVEGF